MLLLQFRRNRNVCRHNRGRFDFHQLDFRGNQLKFLRQRSRLCHWRLQETEDLIFILPVLSNTTHQYNNVLGFSANDTVAINNEGAVTIGSGGRYFTTTGVQVAAGDALHEFNYTTGAIVNISGTLENYIHINGGVSTSSAQIVVQLSDRCCWIDYRERIPMSFSRRTTTSRTGRLCS